MEEYHKIKTVWKRDPENNLKTLLHGQWALPEFEYLQNNTWHIDEKVDGTNVRVHFDGTVRIGGRTDQAQMPVFLMEKIQELFPVDKMQDVFEDTEVTLYGEGYGAKIQKGGGDYIAGGCSFILFDIRIGRWWLRREDVEDIAARLGVEMVPLVSVSNLWEAVELVSGGFDSKLRKTAPEGVVMRPTEPMYARNGDRVITKLKCKDFNHKNKLSQEGK